MIKIRYACLPEGLHATAVARGRHATIYLRPGLEPWQRRDALQRLQRSARFGYAPPLSPFGVARALAADRVLGTLRNVVAALQCHPWGALGIVGMLAGLTVTYMTMVTCPAPAGSAGTLPVAAGRSPVPAGGPGLGAVVPMRLQQRGWRIPEARPRRKAHSTGPAGPVRPRHRSPYRYPSHGGTPHRGGTWLRYAGGWWFHHQRGGRQWLPRQHQRRWSWARQGARSGWPRARQAPARPPAGQQRPAHVPARHWGGPGQQWPGQLWRWPWPGGRSPVHQPAQGVTGAGGGPSGGGFPAWPDNGGQPG